MGGFFKGDNIMLVELIMLAIVLVISVADR